MSGELKWTFLHFTLQPYLTNLSLAIAILNFPCHLIRPGIRPARTEMGLLDAQNWWQDQVLHTAAPLSKHSNEGVLGIVTTDIVQCLWCLEGLLSKTYRQLQPQTDDHHLAIQLLADQNPTQGWDTAIKVHLRPYLAKSRSTPLPA